MELLANTRGKRNEFRISGGDLCCRSVVGELDSMGQSLLSF
jgi:hypothetical protein